MRQNKFCAILASDSYRGSQAQYLFLNAAENNDFLFVLAASGAITGIFTISNPS